MGSCEIPKKFNHLVEVEHGIVSFAGSEFFQASGAWNGSARADPKKEFRCKYLFGCVMRFQGMDSDFKVQDPQVHQGRFQTEPKVFSNEGENHPPLREGPERV